MSATVVKLPDLDLADVPRTLRNLADAIERGEYGQAFNAAWVIDCGDGKVAVGMCGQSPLPGADAHLLLAMGMRKLELL